MICIQLVVDRNRVRDEIGLIDGRYVHPESDSCVED